MIKFCRETSFESPYGPASGGDHLQTRLQLTFAALYIAALACLKHNPKMKALYDRKVFKGKEPKQALIYVAKKLAHLCLSMLYSGESYNPARIFIPAWCQTSERLVTAL